MSEPNIDPTEAGIERKQWWAVGAVSLVFFIGGLLCELFAISAESSGMQSVAALLMIVSLVANIFLFVSMRPTMKKFAAWGPEATNFGKSWDLSILSALNGIMLVVLSILVLMIIVFLVVS